MKNLASSFFLQAVVSLLMLSLPTFGQHSPLEQSVEYSKADVEKALRELQGYSEGKLPIVDGFVVPENEPLDRYQRAYYHVSFVVTSGLPQQTALKVTAKITAWYEGDTAARSGYRALPSNGRLESDLFDRLQQLLPPTHGSTKAAESSVSTPTSGETNKVLPDAPGYRLPNNSAFNVSGKLTSPAVIETSNSKAVIPDGNTARIRQLSDEKSALEEIARNQSHPDNLASVVVSHTPVFAQPSTGAHILFYADAQDEFPVLGAKDNWVHVTISGISRGWVRRSQIDLSAVTSGTSTATASSPRTGGELFRSTREETSPFPGTWEPLQGKSVKVIWVEPATQSEGNGKLRLKYAMSLMRKASQARATAESGVVIVFDSAAGGMVAATTASLKRWQDGGLSDESFEKQCWFSPVEAFVNSQQP